MKKICTKMTALEINGKRISSSGNVWYKVYAQKVNKWIIATL